MLTAIVADDHPFVVSAIKSLLCNNSFKVLAEANNGADAVTLTIQHNPDFIVLDLSMPMLDGLEVINRICASGVKTKILVLTSYPANIYSRRCIKAGASGFINKTADLSELIKVIEVINSGGMHFPELFRSSAQARKSHAKSMKKISKLSDRELLVLQELARGKKNKIISEELLLSTKTISTYRRRLCDKLKIRSLISIVEYARRHDLI